MNDIGEQVQHWSAQAIKAYQERAGGQLDYSKKSLEIVEEMLAEAAGYITTKDPAPIRALVERFGSYILETARAEFGGKYGWYDARNQPVLIVGEPEFRLAIITWDKVRGRLDGKEGHNIPFFYDGFATQVRSADPGTDALYL